MGFFFLFNLFQVSFTVTVWVNWFCWLKVYVLLNTHLLSTGWEEKVCSLEIILFIDSKRWVQDLIENIFANPFCSVLQRLVHLFKRKYESAMYKNSLLVLFFSCHVFRRYEWVTVVCRLSTLHESSTKDCSCVAHSCGIL